MGVLSDEDLVAMRARARHRLIGALALVVLLVVGLPLVLDRHDPPPPPVSADGDARPPGETKEALPDAMPPSQGAAADAGAPATQGTGAPATLAAGPGPAAEPVRIAAQPPKPVPEPAKTATDAPKPATDVAKPAAEAPKPAAEAPKPAAEAPKLAADQSRPAAEAPGTIPPLDIKGPVRHSDHTAPAGAHPTPAATAQPQSPSVHKPVRAEQAGSAASGAHAVPVEDGNRGVGTRGWFVQFGVFAEASRAEALARRLSDHGITARDETIQGPRGSFRRVRAGPFGARDGADEVLARARALGENAILVHQ